MVAEIARDPETRGLPISGIGGITTWRDAVEFMALGAGNVQVCTAAMTYGFKIVQEMISGLSELDGREGLSPRSTTIVGRAVRNVTDWQYPQPQLCRARRASTRMPASSAAAATSPARIPRTRRSPRWSTVSGISRSSTTSASAATLCVNVCPVRGLHHHGSRWSPASSTSAPGRRCRPVLRQLDAAPEQPVGQAGRGVGFRRGRSPKRAAQRVHRALTVA